MLTLVSVSVEKAQKPPGLAHTQTPGTEEVETAETEVQGSPWLHSETAYGFFLLEETLCAVYRVLEGTVREDLEHLLGFHLQETQHLLLVSAVNLTHVPIPPPQTYTQLKVNSFKCLLI